MNFMIAIFSWSWMCLVRPVDRPLKQGNFERMAMFSFKSRVKVSIRKRAHQLSTALGLIFWILTPCLFATDIRMDHSPRSPRSEDSVRVTAQVPGPPYPTEMWLHYQIVKPGQYIARTDPEFTTRWETVRLSDDGTLGDQRANDGILSATLPSRLQQNRHLTRYFVSPNHTVTETEFEESQKKAYFVYDGVPDFLAAINPRSHNTKLSTPKRFPSEALTRVPVYHLISKNDWIEEATWKPRRRGYRSGNDHQYEHTGTLVYDGIVYDHIQFRARGGGWRHAMGKNMWKINFHREQPFQAKDNFGKPYRSTWDKLNLGACIQQGQYRMRGEHGMFDALTYRLFNLAGTPAPRTHWIHFRIVDDEHEALKSQYEGDFWGLYLAVENIDEFFIHEHDLAQGNLYKIENLQPHERYLGVPFHSPISNPYPFIRSLSRGGLDETWWQERVDLDRYYRYRSILECVRHYDVAHGKNYFFLFDGGQARWLQIPWDVDLTWTDYMYGTGREPFQRAQIFRNKTREDAYHYQLTEIRDLLFNSLSMNQLIDDHAAIIDPAIDSLSLADADRAMWDFHPIMNSRYSMPHQAGQGQFYFQRPEGSFEDMVSYMKDFARQRQHWVDKNLLRGYRPANAPELKMEQSNRTFRFSANHEAENTVRWEWRLARIQTQDLHRRRAPLYEIEGDILKQEHSDSVQMSRSELEPGTYRIRARGVRQDGEKTRWSKSIEF